MGWESVHAKRHIKQFLNSLNIVHSDITLVSIVLSRLRTSMWHTACKWCQCNHWHYPALIECIACFSDKIPWMILLSRWCPFQSRKRSHPNPNCSFMSQSCSSICITSCHRSAPLSTKYLGLLGAYAFMYDMASRTSLKKVFMCLNTPTSRGCRA